MIERIGALETWHCQSCGAEETMHVYDPSMNLLLHTNLDPAFKVVGRWIKKPTSQQISKVKAAFPALRDVPISALLRKAIEKLDIDLGSLTDVELSDSTSLLTKAGIEITKIPIQFNRGN